MDKRAAKVVAFVKLAPGSITERRSTPRCDIHWLLRHNGKVWDRVYSLEELKSKATQIDVAASRPVVRGPGMPRRCFMITELSAQTGIVLQCVVYHCDR